MLVSSCTSVSLDPAMLSICIQSSSRTWASLRTSGEVGVSFLSDSQDRLCARFAGAGPERLAGTDIVVTDQGAVLVPDAVAWFTCSIRDEIPAGDHVIVLLGIESYGTRPGLSPLIFHRSAFTRLPR
ncbi:flavin reductase family protein [Actinokineospora sp. PR83]|uniref:flavin reductase family protein n=1 Tax=Actinokineospora sp. PR83 TaxID=2884908 RepID=UPI001F25409F|nr:flavin reductase family protein [Actinokineospora sp. PR83]MCG8919745.1 flavin reductase family protein [Actinokineospora sp. PR83]